MVFRAEISAFEAMFTMFIRDVTVVHAWDPWVSGEIGGEDGGTGGLPSRLREEKVGMSGLPTDITLRLPEAVGGEGRIWRGR